MPGVPLIDHSSHNLSPSPKIPSASRLVLIDNYDSFTFNVFQYLELEGATVEVFRNDKITLQELIAKNPTQLVVSPGPGHPDTDAGISIDAIRYFSGRIPILGVCMGQQCIISAFGGQVDVTGEILHGKTSPLRHDSLGVYDTLPQDIPVTRYHSLAGTHPTLPQCLEISSWIEKGPDGGKGVIMGVRHKSYVIEGVQFHPESILTEGGRTMIRNFLHMEGGRWDQEKMSSNLHPYSILENRNGIRSPNLGRSTNSKSSILDEIFEHRQDTVEMQKKIPSKRLEDLQAAYDLGLAPPQVSFPQRLSQSPFPLALMAEIKRASPSKGIISLKTSAPSQAREYAKAGASVISVLTEPKWFKGSIDDLRAVRQSLECMQDRPAVLCKEFIFDEYQILEARLAGADTILLIVKMLDTVTLTRLFKYSQSLGMEPLVEVNTAAEMDVAVKLGARVIGVNNRDLKNFQVDLGTTSRLMDHVPSSTIVCALSGISGPSDVASYGQGGVKAILVGEALMRAPNTLEFVKELLGSPTKALALPMRVAVKICGTRTPEAAKAAIESGADFIGIILVPNRSRYVSDEQAMQISRVVKSAKKFADLDDAILSDPSYFPKDFFESTLCRMTDVGRALLVGVFQNAPLDHIISKIHTLGLDAVQLHGSEPLEWCRMIPVPVIRRFAPGEPGLSSRGYHVLPLLDSGLGGSGERLDFSWTDSPFLAQPDIKVGLAGGLDALNVASILERLGSHRRKIAMVDVSSGVETNGQQDPCKIRSFVRAAKAIP